MEVEWGGSLTHIHSSHWIALVTYSKENFAMHLAKTQCGGFGRIMQNTFNYYFEPGSQAKLWRNSET